MVSRGIRFLLSKRDVFIKGFGVGDSHGLREAGGGM